MRSDDTTTEEFDACVVEILGPSDRGFFLSVSRACLIYKNQVKVVSETDSWLPIHAVIHAWTGCHSVDNDIFDPLGQPCADDRSSPEATHVPRCRALVHQGNARYDARDPHAFAMLANAW